MGLQAVEILLVEDSKADAKMTKRAFAQSKVNNTLHIVEDGEQALFFLKKEAPYQSVPLPDLILLDLNLPKIDGRELLKIIKEDSKLRHIPVIILTTSSSEEDVLRSYDLHANSYITKPVDFASLVDIVRGIDCFWFNIVRLPGEVQ